MGLLNQGPEHSGRSGHGKTFAEQRRKAQGGSLVDAPMPLDDGLRRMSPMTEALLGKYKTVSQTARLQRITGPFVATNQMNYGLNRETARKMRKG